MGLLWSMGLPEGEKDPHFRMPWPGFDVALEAIADGERASATVRRRFSAAGVERIDVGGARPDGGPVSAAGPGAASGRGDVSRCGGRDRWAGPLRRAACLARLRRPRRWLLRCSRTSADALRGSARVAGGRLERLRGHASVDGGRVAALGTSVGAEAAQAMASYIGA
ncbi:MAG: hypothetical protein ICV69_13780 [Thermoleophilaceae bacterium]|nr:hypothetical protein [Thermoleophilaceae bacterium]